MSESAKMVISDPSKFGLVATEVKKDLIQGAIATVNVMAGRGRKEAVANVQSSFTNRNNFTVRQIQFTPMPESKYIKISAIQSFVGATEKAPYMARQEQGGKHTPAQGQTLAIPTDLARGGSRLRPVAASMRVNKLGKRRRVHGAGKRRVFHSEKALKVARAYVAHKKGLFIPIGDTKGQRNLFMVEKFVKTKKGVAFKLRQVYKFDVSETTTKPEPWLLPASEKVARQVQAIFNSQMKKIEG
jgi:hypothetical protein